MVLRTRLEGNKDDVREASGSNGHTSGKRRQPILRTNELHRVAKTMKKRFSRNKMVRDMDWGCRYLHSCGTRGDAAGNEAMGRRRKWSEAHGKI